MAPGIFLMEVLAPRVVRNVLPGQFVVVRVGTWGERIPLTVCDYNKERGTITLVIQEVGASTRKICALQEGQALLDFAGPLGRPSDFVHLDDAQLRGLRMLFIAGGVGAAPVYPQAKYVHERGAHVEVILGAKNKDFVILEEEMRAVSQAVHVCTDDGSYGFKGMVTACLAHLMDQGAAFDQAVAIGPMVMMKFVTMAAQPYHLPLIVSLNTLMVDATGMCGACRVSVGGKTQFACVDGPEFDAYQVDFDQAMRRQTLYKTQEAAADHVCRLEQALHQEDSLS